jgi:hypothetical protein
VPFSISRAVQYIGASNTPFALSIDTARVFNAPLAVARHPHAELARPGAREGPAARRFCSRNANQNSGDGIGDVIRDEPDPGACE